MAMYKLKDGFRFYFRGKRYKGPTYLRSDKPLDKKQPGRIERVDESETEQPDRSEPEQDNSAQEVAEQEQPAEPAQKSPAEKSSKSQSVVCHGTEDHSECDGDSNRSEKSQKQDQINALHNDDSLEPHYAGYGWWNVVNKRTGQYLNDRKIRQREAYSWAGWVMPEDQEDGG